MTTFNPATDNITWVPKNTAGQLRGELLPQRAAAAGEEHAARHRLRRQPRPPAGRLPERQPEESRLERHSQRPYANWPSDITEALNEFYSNYNALQVRYEQRFVAGLTLLNSFTWEHSLDNASASLEGNTPSPQNGLQHPGRLRAVGLQPAHRQRDQPGLRAAVWPRAALPVQR